MNIRADSTLYTILAKVWTNREILERGVFSWCDLAVMVGRLIALGLFWVLASAIVIAMVIGFSAVCISVVAAIKWVLVSLFTWTWTAPVPVVQSGLGIIAMLLAGVAWVLCVIGYHSDKFNAWKQRMADRCGKINVIR